MRIAIRYLLRAPGFTAGAIATLALAIGASSAMFGAVYAVLLQPASIRQPEHLVIAWEKDAARNQDVVELSYRNFQDWTAHSRSFSQVAALGSSTWPAVLNRSGESIGVSHAGVSASFFETLGVVPEIGRGLRAEDDEPGAPRVVVLSHRFWVSRFGADPRVVGTTIEIRPAHTIVGVMPEAFDFPRGTDYWTPVVPILASSGLKSRTDTLERAGVLFVIGRLRDGVTPALATEELNGLAARLQREGGAYRFGSTVIVTPLIEYMLGPVRPALWALLAAVGVLTLIGCANVSGLMLTRVAVRSREQAIRLALGASRRHLSTHWAFETLIVATAGGLLGLLCSRWITQAIAALAPEDVPRLSDISINLPVAAFTLLAVLATAVLCGAAPIRRAVRSNLAHALSDSSRATPGRQSARARSLLVIVQIALTVVLLVAAGLVARSFVNLRRTDLGIHPSNVLTLHVGPRDPQPSTNQWIRMLVQRLSALPDVEQAGAVYLRPLSHGPIGQETSVILEGQPMGEASARRNPNLNYQVVTPGYFGTMRIPLRRGRLFDSTDAASSRRVVLVGESVARRLWPGKDPIGQRLLMATQETDGSAAWRTVVGVVGDVRYRGIDDVRLDVYDPALQSPLAAADLVIRTSGDPLRLVASVLTEARGLDKQVVVDGITTMDAIVARALAPWRFSVWLFMMFAALAFVLATVGLVSLITLDVANRRHELAVRLALGAAPSQLVRSVAIAAGWRVVAGVVLGVPAALSGTRAMRSLLVGVGTADVTTYASVLALVSAVVAVAAYLPARRAAAIDPMALLRGG